MGFWKQKNNFFRTKQMQEALGRIQNPRGASLVEILVVSTMITITGLATLSMISTSMKANKHNQEMDASQELLRLLNEKFAVTAYCNRNFGPAPGNNRSLGSTVYTTDIVNLGGATDYDVAPATPVGYPNPPNGLWLIKDYKIELQTVLSTSPQVEIARLIFTLEKRDPTSSLGFTTINRSIHLWTQLTAAGGTIVSCRSLGAAGNEFWRTTNGTDIFNTNPGNVGIGTPTPRSALDVAGGAIRVRAGTPANDAAAVGIGFEDNGDTGLFMTNWTGPGTGDLSLYSNATQSLTVFPDGSATIPSRLGIGITTNPATPLAVNGNTSIVNGSLGFNRNPIDGTLPPNGNAAMGRFQLTPQANHMAIQSYSTAGIQTGMIAILAANGNIGIGTTTPGQQLQVNGITQSTAYRSDQGAPAAGDVSVTGYAFGGDGDTGIFSPGAAAVNNGNVAVYSNSTEVARFTGASLGVGTTSPQTTLDVNGGIRPGSATTGAACSPEGTFGYDNALHEPVYCNNAGIWKRMGSFNPILVKVMYRYTGEHATAYCPVGTKVVGGGCDWDSDNEGPDISSNPTDSLDGWHCWNDMPDTGRDIYVYAICN